MFIQNIKINGKFIYRIMFIIFLISILWMILYGVNKIFNNKTLNVNSNVCKIDQKNYTNVLKAVHEDIDSYVGTNIKFSGFVYRLKEFNKNQFVLGRNMIVSDKNHVVVVGFLCDLNEANIYKDGEWVDIEGKIEKGEFYGEIPIVKIKSIKRTDVPKNQYVYPPDKNYIPTSNML